jgi:hypothetical protein
MFDVILVGPCIGVGDVKIRLTKVMFLTTHTTNNVPRGDSNLSPMSFGTLVYATNSQEQSPVHDLSLGSFHLTTPPNLMQSNQEETMAIQFEAID